MGPCLRKRRRRAVDAEEVVQLRNHEQQPASPGAHDVRQGFQLVVARPVAERDGFLIENLDESVRAAARRNIQPRLRFRRDADERRLTNKVLHVLMQVIDLGSGDDRHGRFVQGAQLLQAADDVRIFSAHGNHPFRNQTGQLWLPGQEIGSATLGEGDGSTSFV